MQKSLRFHSCLIGDRYSSGLTLPDFMRNADGSFSREKTLQTICSEEYGIVDDTATSLFVEDITSQKTWKEMQDYVFCGKTVYTALRFSFTKGEKSASFEVDLLLPRKAETPNVVVMIDFSKHLPTKHCPVEELLDGGLGIAHVYYQEIATDDNDFENGIAKLYCDRSRQDSPGKLALWAYAVGKIGQYLIEQGYVLKENLYCAGHSRLGKTALLACAEYAFFAGCFVNCSGSCGAAIAREKHGETIQAITEMFPFWFMPSFSQYAGREELLPFDQHYLVAACAPRKVFVVAASEDDWADTDAQYLCMEAGSVAYREMDRVGLVEKDRMLAVGEKNDGGDIKFFLRKGPHFFSREDWQFYMDRLKQ